MTVTTTTNNASFAGNDVVTVLPFTFRFFTDADLVVVTIDDATGDELLLVLGVDYTVQGAGNASGGSVTLTVPLETGKTANVARVLELTQLVELINQGKFFPEIHENVFDYLTMLIQQGNSSGERSLVFPLTDDPGLNRTLPAIAARALKALGFDVDGEPVVSSLTLAEIEAQVPLAAASASAASASAAAALVSEGLAEQWAQNPEDDPVLPGEFSALHWAAKAQGFALSAVGLNTVRIDVASAATVDLTASAPNTRHINITGGIAIAGFTIAAGQCYFVRFNAAGSLVNSANLVTQRGADILTAAGDTCIIRATAANVVEVLCGVFASERAVGVGQTWQDVSGSRAKAVTYTNTTGRPIVVSIISSAANSTVGSFSVGGITVSSFNSGSTTSVQLQHTAVVPAGSTYRIDSNGAIAFWAELR